MSDRMLCPGCETYSSGVLGRVMRSEPCPYCGLPASTIMEVDSVRRNHAESELADRLTVALVKLGRAEVERDLYLARLSAVREALNGGEESYRDEDRCTATTQITLGVSHWPAQCDRQVNHADKLHHAETGAGNVNASLSWSDA